MTSFLQLLNHLGAQSGRLDDVIVDFASVDKLDQFVAVSRNVGTYEIKHGKQFVHIELRQGRSQTRVPCGSVWAHQCLGAQVTGLLIHYSAVLLILVKQDPIVGIDLDLCHFENLTKRGQGNVAVIGVRAHH